MQSFFGNNLFQTAKALNEILRPLEGEALDYYALSYGKLKTQSSICTLYHARVSVAQIVVQNDTSGTMCGSHRNVALIVELTGDRFLRRMVRKLVATALRLLLPILSSEHETKTSSLPNNNNTDSIYDGSTNNLGKTLSKIVQSKDRRDSAKAAPPNGLILVGAEMKNRPS